MPKLKVRIKKFHPNAVIPKYANLGDAGVDLVAISKEYEESTECWVYGTGLGLELPDGYVGLIFPRSSLTKYSLSLGNHVGVIDAGYRGEVKFKFKPNPLSSLPTYKVGDKIGQLIVIPYPEVEFEEVDELTSTERGAGGYGSTGA